MIPYQGAGPIACFNGSGGPLKQTKNKPKEEYNLSNSLGEHVDSAFSNVMNL